MRTQRGMNDYWYLFMDRVLLATVASPHASCQLSRLERTLHSSSFICTVTSSRKVGTISAASSQYIAYESARLAGIYERTHASEKTMLRFAMAQPHGGRARHRTKWSAVADACLICLLQYLQYVFICFAHLRFSKSSFPALST
jgi:hypothetical protein